MKKHYTFLIKDKNGEWIELKGLGIIGDYHDDQEAFMALHRKIALRKRLGNRRALTVTGDEIKWKTRP